MLPTLRFSLCGALTAIALSSACGSQDDGVGAQITRGGGAAGRGGNGAENQPGDNASGGGTGGILDAGPLATDAGVYVPAEPDATCAATSQEAKQVTTTKEVTVEVPHEEIKPVAIYLMLDRSSSMVGGCAFAPDTCNPESWNQATQAIAKFTGDPASANINVALGYFPPIVAQTDTSATGPLCGGSACASAAVPMGRAMDNAQPIQTSMAAATPPARPPYTNTPTSCALRGMDAFCKDHTARTGEKCVGVLVTDGRPTSACAADADAAMLAQFAADSLAGGTPIFAVGLTGADFTFLDGIAQSGGTDCSSGMGGAAGRACDVSSGVDSFVAALNAIREKVVVTETHVETETVISEEPIDCEWKIPPPPDRKKFDKDEVNVRFAATGKPDRVIGRVPAGQSCDAHPDAWRFDDADNPTKILACPATCEEIKASPGARVSIELGCQTQVLE